MQSNVNVLSIAFFFVFMGLTLFITYWAAKRTSTTEHFFAAGGQITAWQNGWGNRRNIRWNLRSSKAARESNQEMVCPIRTTP